MKLVVFGANGKVGSLVVEQLLTDGHQVVAFVHGKNGLTSNPQLEIFQGDIYDAGSVTKAITGADAVLSTLGSWGTPKKDVLTVGMRHIIAAMNAQGLKRIVSLTGSDSRATGDTIGFAHRLSHVLLSLLAPKVLRDGEQHLALLEKSGLDWTVIRSPAMTEIGDPKKYALGIHRPLPWQTIHRQSVVGAMLQVLRADSFLRQAPFLHRNS